MSSFDEYRKKLANKYGTSSTKKKDEEEESRKVKSSSTGSTTTEKTNSGAASKSKTSFDEYREKLNAKYRTDKIDEKGVDKWFSDADKAFKSIQDGKDKDPVSTVNTLLDSSNDVYNYFLNHKDEIEDFETWEKAISDYRSALTKYDRYYYQQERSIPDEYKGKGYDELKEMLKTMEKGSEEYNWLSNYAPYTLMGADDFDEYSKKGSSIENPSMKDAEGWATVFGNRLGAKNVGNIVTYSRDNWEDIAMGEANNGNVVGSSLYHYMTDDEVNIYNYLLAKNGEEEAQEYLDSITETLNYRSGTAQGERVRGEENDVLRTIATGVYGVGAGFDQAATGIKQLFSEDALPTTSAQFASAYIREDLADTGPKVFGNSLGQMLYDAVTTTSNMAPSILVGALTGVPVAGAATLGASATGNAYGQALKEGYTKEQARNYGILIGASETALQYLLGGISSMGGKVTGKTVQTTIQNIDNALLRAAADIGINMASEGMEEYIQEILDPVYRNLLLGEDNEFKLVSEDAAYSFILGALTAGVMEGSPAVTRYVDETSALSDVYGADVGALIGEALEINPENKFAQKMQSRLDEGRKISGGQISTLINQNERGMVTNDINAITEAATSRLTKLGETGDVDAIGAAVAKQAAGRKLTKAEKQTISNSRYGQRVANELNTENINAETHSSAWAERIGTNRINPDEYNRLVAEAEITQESAETSADTIPTPTQNAPQRMNTEAVEAPTATVPEEVEAVSVPEETAQVEAVEEVSAEVSDNENVITIEDASKKYGAQAGAMLHTYRQGQDVAKYDAAYEQAYNMGQSGVSLSYTMNSESTAYLTEAQRELAYKAGKAASDTAATEKEATNKQGANGKTSRKKGTVRGDGVTISDLKKTFNDTQNTAYKLLSTYAEATGIDIVLYRSEANANGRYEGAQGKYSRNDPGTIYIDINAGLSSIKSVNDLAKYTMLRTFAHEFTHFIENWNPVQYNEFRKLVFDTLTERGENVQDLIEEKQAATPGMSYDKASREVVAEAMTDILPDANFVEELANNHKTIFDKLIEKLKEFVNTLRQYFNSIGHNRSREANALKEQVGDALHYVESIVKLFDKIAVQAVENYQLTVAVDEVTGETTVEETKAEPEVTESVEPVIEESETIPEAAPEVPFDKRIISLLKGSGRLAVTELDGQKYITNGSIVLPITSEAAEKYAYTEFNALRSDFNEAIKKTLAGANTLITKAPVEGKGGRESIYIFDENGKKMYFAKKLMSYIDGGLLYYGDFIKNGYVIKSVGEDGSVKGYILSMKIEKDSAITDRKQSKLKSFSKKMQALIDAQTAPAETVAETPTPAPVIKEEVPFTQATKDQYDKISDALQNMNVFRKGGYEFSVRLVPGAGYDGTIKRHSDKYTSNARDVIFSSMFATRPEAVADIAGVARNNRLLETATPTPTVKEEAAPAKVAAPEAGTASEKLAAKLLDGYINSENINRGGKALTSKELYALADEAFGGTQAEGAYNRKDAYDAMELAVNKFLLEEAARAHKTFNGTAKSAVSTVEFMQDMLDLLPTQNVRTQEMEDFQQFSTPPNIAYLAAWAANITSKDFVLEPSAGIGGLAVFAKAWGAEVTVNELSKRRLEVLRAMGFDHLFNENAEHIDNILPDNISPSVVIMNPPFSSTAGRTANNKTSNAEKHIDQALARLRDGGRLVAVLGKGMNDTDYYRYWDKLRKSYNIRANLSIDGNNYKKYGTTWGVQIVVIDKTGPQTGKTVTGKFTDLTEVPNVLEVIRNDRSTEIKPAPVVTSSESTPVTDGAAKGQDTVSDAVSVDDSRPAGDKGSRKRTDTGRAVDASQPGIGEQSAGVQNVDRAGGRDVSGPDILTERADEAPETGINAATEEQTGTVVSNDDTVAGNDSGEFTSERDEPGAEPARSGEIEQSDDGVYATFIAPDVPVKGGKKHPAVLVESAAMAAVSMPKATYTVKLPANVIKNNLSDAQLVTVTYAGQAHEQKLPDGRRKGFFVGDGTGVGKGRQIAGIILDNFTQGRTKAVWISKNNDLYGDAIRDWTATTGRSKDEVVSHNKVKPKDKISIKEGILYSTYDTLKSEKGGSRLEQIVEWLGEDFDGVIAFDEAHNMGNLFGKKGKFGKSKGSEKARAGVELQRRLPNARIVYVSATAATEVDNLAYAERIGLWGAGTAFASAQDFIAKIGASGLAAMELVIRDMKAMGTYVARSISYNGVNYDTVEHALDPMQTEIYNTMSRAWQKTMSNVQSALETTGGKYNSTERQRAMGNFYSGMQRFYNQVLTSMAMPSVIADMRRELDAGHSAVLQIVNTNEAQQNKQLAEAKANGESLDNLDLTPREALLGYLMNSFPTQMFEEYTDDDGNLRSRPVMDSAGNPVQNKEAVRQRDALVAEVNQMSIPDGPLEMLFDAFGPEGVAENTGRSRRVVPKKMADGSITRVEERRTLNHRTADVQAFQDGKKRILVFSDAGGTGKSYHADRTEKNQQLRIHYVLQPGWVASNAVQGFGRTHRSNEASAPIYKLVTTNIKGQKRFTSTIARRLDQLGALTKGQRDTGSGMFGAKDNLETDLAKDSLREFYRRLGKNLIEGVDGMKTLDRLGLKEKFTDEFGGFKINDNLARDISTFLNRILALEVDEQNVVFDAFISIYEMELEAAIQSGTLDTGMENVKADKIEVVDDKVIRKDDNTGSETHYIQAKTYTKPKVVTTIAEMSKRREGFVGVYRTENGAVRAVFRIADKTTEWGAIQKQYRLVGPNLGAKTNVWNESTLKAKAEEIDKADWQKEWDAEVARVPEYNEDTLHMLTGALLPIWNSLPQEGNTKVKRLITHDGDAYLGRVIDKEQIDSVLHNFSVDRTREVFTAQQVMDKAIDNGVRFYLTNNRTEIFRSRVSGEWRLEIVQPYNAWFLRKTYPDLIQERIQYRDRFFIPVGEKGVPVLEKILKDNPVRNTADDTEQYQQRTSTLTNREILAMASGELNIGELNVGEQEALNIFQKHLARLEELEEKRIEQGRLYKEQQFGENGDRKAAAETLNRMHILDEQIRTENDDLFTIEEKAVLRRILEKARKVVEQTEREHGKEILKRWRDRRNNAAAIKKYRERLRGDVDELSNWVLHPNNKDVVKHIPDALKNSVIPFLSSINFMSKQSLKGGRATVADKEFIKRLNDLKATLKPHLNVDDMYNAYTDLPPNFMDRLDTFITSAQALVDNNSGEFIINQMTAEELRELSQVVRTLKEYIKNFNKFHVNAMFKHVYEAGDDTILSLGQMKNAGPRTGNISNFVLWQQMRPAYAFERFGDGGKAIYDGLRRGQATLAFNTKKIQEFAEKAYTAAEVKAWEKEIKEIRLGGDIIKMPVSTIMSFYELSKRPQALGHILGEGIRVATFKANGKKISDIGHTITNRDMQTIIDTLTPRQKEVADNLQKFMQEQGGKWGNYVSVKRFGEELFGEKNYFPINSDGRHLSVNAEEHPAAASLYALLNMGFTKSTQEGAINRIVLYSIFDVFANHMASMAQYNAFALPVVDAIKWFNYQQKSEPDENGSRAVLGSVRDQMDRVYGVPEETRPGSGRQGYAQTFVINILKAFNGTEAQGVPSDTTGLNALRQYNMAQVAYNLRVVMQQPMAITRAAQILDYTSILKGMKLNPKAIQRNIAEMQKYSGIAAWKSLGFYDINISRGLTEIIKHRSTVRDKISDVGMWGAEKADLMTWAAMWSAAKQEVIRKQKLTPKSEGFYEAVTELFEEVIYKTQVVDSVLTKNEFLRSKGFFSRAIGSFMSEPTTTASMLVNAFDKYMADIQRGFSKQKAWKRNSRMIVRTAYVYGIGAVSLAAVQAVADALRDDDDYMTFMEKWLDAFKGNAIDELIPVNKLPILSDFYEAGKELLSVLGVDTYGNAPQSVFMQWYDSLIKGTEILYDRISGADTNYTWYGGAYKLLQAVSGMTGLPMAATTRELVTAWNNTVGSMAPSLKVKSYEPSEQAEIKYAYQDGYLTAEEATKELIEKGVVDTENEAYFLIAEWGDPDGSYSRYDKLYDAARNGGDFEVAMDELVSHGYTEKDVLSQLKGKIGEWYKGGEISKQQATDMLTKHFDMDGEEITATVNKWSSKVVTGIEFNDIKDEYLSGNITASRAAEMYARYGGYSKAEAQQKVAEWNFEEEHGFTYGNRGEQFKEGNISGAELVEMIVDFGGKSEDEARASLVGYTKSGYEEGYFTSREAVNMMVEHGGLTEAEAEAKVRHVDFQREYPEYELSEAQVTTYYNELEYTGLGVPEYAEYLERRKESKGVDADGDGKTDSGSVKAEVMVIINSLPITTEQKDALYYLNGWAASRIYEAPWH